MDQGSSSFGSNPSRQGPPDNLPRPNNATASPKPEGIDLRFPDSTAGQNLPKPPSPDTSGSLPPTAPLSTTKGPATTSVPTEYKTSIRTMAEDISKVKVGQKPSGVEIQKTIPVAPRPVAPAVPAPQPSAPASSIKTSLGQPERSQPLAAPAPMPQAKAPSAPVRPEVSLGRPESTRPLAPSAPMPRPSAPVRPAPQATLPGVPRPSSSRGILYLILAGILLSAAGLYWILGRGNNDVAETPTPIVIASKTPTPTPVPDISTYIGGATETITLATTGNIAADFLNKINALSINPGEMRKITVSSETKGSGDFGMIDLLSQLGLAYPVALESGLGADSLILVFGQRESFTATGQPNLTAAVQKRIVFLTEAKEVSSVTQTVSTWESTIVDTFVSLFALNKAKASGTGFESNPYLGTSIRFRNYPYPDKSIDHAIIPARNGKLYLMIAGSRESAFSTVDVLKK